MARPTKYDKKYCDKAKKLAEKGCTDKEIAYFLEITEQTLNNWKEQYPEFFESLKAGKEIPDKNVERALYQRCIGYKCKAVKIMLNKQGEVLKIPYIEHYPPDPTSIIYWSKNRMPERWRDTRHTELTGKDGKPVEYKNMTDADLDKEIAEAEKRLGSDDNPGKGKSK